MKRLFKNLFAVGLLSWLIPCLIIVYKDRYGIPNNRLSYSPVPGFDEMTALLIAPIIALVLILYIMVEIIRFRSINVKDYISLIIHSNLITLFLSCSFYIVYNINIVIMIITVIVINLALVYKAKYYKEDTSYIVPLLVLVYLIAFFMIRHIM